MRLYERLADDVAWAIGAGVYPPGTRLPSVRDVSRHRGVSVSTCVRAYHELERRGVIEAAPRSGFFVVGRRHSALPTIPGGRSSPVAVAGSDRILQLLAAATDPRVVNFGAATPHPDYMPGTAVAAASRTVWGSARRRCMSQAFPPGAVELRTAVARRLAMSGCRLDPDGILITNGCQEAMAIALKTLCRPGDVVAVEAPTYYGLLEVLEQQQLRALPIPADPSQGISLEALDRALQTGDVRACVVTPVASNPLGVTLSDERKQALVDLVERHAVALIEDDTYGELVEAGRRHTPVKAWDRTGLVYYCGSATKTICAGLRVGWLVAPASRRQSVAFEQYLRTISVNTQAQLTLAQYLATGQVDRQLRSAARSYRGCVSELIARIERHFPAGTLISAPQGGFLVWVELPGAVDTASLLGEALKRGISFAPGALFAPDDRFGNCMRLNAAVAWNGRSYEALETLGGLIERSSGRSGFVPNAGTGADPGG
ncbi:Histidinol-phosphate aminotransferase [wastewater metagenome]|uniref:Histidinol-phosphate aminotransferase n=2 Tax=unclassified sequences TaxID=12908 RepID=A0A5B8RHV3_9ZZZZ|nr:histidinol-phosphate aminotransferase [uncultured organism]